MIFFFVFLFFEMMKKKALTGSKMFLFIWERYGKSPVFFVHFQWLLTQIFAYDWRKRSLILMFNLLFRNATGTPESLRQTATTTTMNLFPMTERSAGVSGIPARNMNLKSMNLFPQQAGFGSSVSKDDAPKIVNSRWAQLISFAIQFYNSTFLSFTDYYLFYASVKKSGNVEPQTAQMTIFYGGQVIVFNDFPADKAKEVMRLAGMGSSPVPSTTVKNPIDAGGMAPSTPNVVPNFANSLIQERIQRPAQPVACGNPFGPLQFLYW